MNTIYDGSFLLGETSGLNFQAGPGISITQPSEGTVRIANDETVLWSGSLASGATATLSEPITAFERIGFDGYCHNGSGYSVYGEAPVYSSQVRIAAMTFWPGSPEFDLVKCECDTNTMTCHGTSILYNGQTLNNGGTITKVVGINRKANA